MLGRMSGSMGTELRQTVFEGVVIEWLPVSGHLQIQSSYTGGERGYLINPREMSVVWVGEIEDQLYKDQDQVLDISDSGWYDFFCPGDRVMIYSKKSNREPVSVSRASSGPVMQASMFGDAVPAHLLHKKGADEKVNQKSETEKASLF